MFHVSTSSKLRKYSGDSRLVWKSNYQYSFTWREGEKGCLYFWMKMVWGNQTMLEMEEEEEEDTAMTCWGAWSVVLGWAWLVLPPEHLAVLIQVYLLFGSEKQDRHWKIQHGNFPLKDPSCCDSFVATATIFLSVFPLVVSAPQEQMSCERWTRNKTFGHRKLHTLNESPLCKIIKYETCLVFTSLGSKFPVFLTHISTSPECLLLNCLNVLHTTWCVIPATIGGSIRYTFTPRKLGSSPQPWTPSPRCVTQTGTILGVPWGDIQNLGDLVQ